MVRIKGIELTVFNKNNTNLPSSTIQAIAAEDDGTIWVGTDNGLARFDGGDWRVYNTQNTLLKDNEIKCITYDSRHKTIWVGTENGIIKIGNPNGWEYIEKEYVIHAMAVDQNGVLWLGVFDDFAFRG